MLKVPGRLALALVLLGSIWLVTPLAALYTELGFTSVRDLINGNYVSLDKLLLCVIPLSVAAWFTAGATLNPDLEFRCGWYHLEGWRREAFNAELAEKENAKDAIPQVVDPRLLPSESPAAKQSRIINEIQQKVINGKSLAHEEKKILKKHQDAVNEYLKDA